MAFARGVGQALRLAPVRACFGFGRGSGCHRRFRRFNSTALVFDIETRGSQFAFDRLQATALGKPPRCAGRRMRRDDKTVPAPQIALVRDEPLAGLEHAGKPRAVGALDDADLGEAARQFGGRFDVLRKRDDAFRQGRIGRVGTDAGPAHRRGLIDRRVEIVAERGPERFFIAVADAERVHHRRPEIFALDGEEFADGLGLGLEPLHAALGGGERRAGSVDLFARLLMRGFRRMRGLLGRGKR